MNVAVVYTAVTNGPMTSDFIARFVATWMACPPMADCDVWVACNGGPLESYQQLMFTPLNARMFPRVNTPGWDVDGYIESARGPCASYDMMLCLGETVFFHREGWLKRLVDAASKYGLGMYGPFASNVVRAHLNTTAFFCPPGLVGKYPPKINSRGDRYLFEHGPQALWRRIAASGMPVRLVTWDGEWEPRLWRYPNNILWRGNQANCLMWCNHVEAWFNANPVTKSHWSHDADSPYK